jgi:glycosyltransferase involved in cell wall biosynthesis
LTGAPTQNPEEALIGACTSEPNVVAAEYLLREVWPRLVRICPKARLLIAGPGSEAIAGFQDPPNGIEFLGFVSDLDALYRRTRVLCCPIQSGGGTRIKILDAASHGVPAVSTPLGAEGIDLVPDAEIVLRSSAAGLAEACADLLTDDARAQRVGAPARKRAARSIPP